MVKEILRGVLGQSSSNYEELNIILYDCEQVINSRGGDLRYKKAFQRQSTSPASDPKQPTLDAASVYLIVTKTS
ncbi:hypothetical protein NPIL_110381 [Nephila pilipes]|uniref:Uncharacterized protein n=1 Tax=Nephila pilipes TaxID=299642 RepID=A0A8X6ND36_NEPPI|nr:hypothetical protein NPIL_110381 [Nephila pilipes]